MSNISWDDDLVIVEDDLYVDGELVTGNSETGSTANKKLNPAQMKEQQQKFAMMHFLFFGLNDFLGIKPNEEV